MAGKGDPAVERVVHTEVAGDQVVGGRADRDPETAVADQDATHVAGDLVADDPRPADPEKVDAFTAVVGVGERTRAG